MKKITMIIALIVIISFHTNLYAQDNVSQLIDEGRELFEKKSYPGALNKFMTAREIGVGEIEDREIALYVGAINVLMNEEEDAIKEMSKYLFVHPEADAPRSFDEQMILALEKARKNFPIVKSMGIAAGTFKPMLEQIEIRYKVEASPETISSTKAKIQIIVQKDNAVAFESDVELKTEDAPGAFKWNAKDRTGKLFESGAYVIRLTATRSDGWKHEKEMPFVAACNINTEKARELIAKSRRASLLEQSLRVDYVPGKHPVEITVKPLLGTTRGFWNTVYYIFIGSIRDGLDFPVKYICSVPYLGHVATCVIPVGGGYVAGQQIFEVDKDDYYDPLFGFDKKSYDSDKNMANLKSAGMGVLGPVWAITYAGIMSVVSWAGTEDGIVNGFNSYIYSNAFNEGYRHKYFFPNYRSLDFTNQRVDEAQLAKMEGDVSKRNSEIAAEIVMKNTRSDAFNQRGFAPFKRQFEEKVTAELNDYIELSIESQNE